MYEIRFSNLDHDFLRLLRTFKFGGQRERRLRIDRRLRDFELRVRS
jgi:hypothetical protein